jgi:hypothetical protein
MVGPEMAAPAALHVWSVAPVVTSDVTIIIPLFPECPDDRWASLAMRSSQSAAAQSVAPAAVMVSFGDTLAAARNTGAAGACTEWLIFLDADDELHHGYVEAMLAGTGDVRQPSTLGVGLDGAEDDEAVLIAPHPGGLLTGNHIVIGAMVRRSLFCDVGGFRELPAAEDWDLWIRCWLEGATLGTCPDAIYRVHTSPAGRNTASAATTDAYHQVRRAYAGRTPIHQEGRP